MEVAIGRPMESAPCETARNLNIDLLSAHHAAWEPPKLSSKAKKNAFNANSARQVRNLETGCVILLQYFRCLTNLSLRQRDKKTTLSTV